MELGSITELYLPTRYWGVVEGAILRKNRSLAAEIIPPEELDRNGFTGRGRRRPILAPVT